MKLRKIKTDAEARQAAFEETPGRPEVELTTKDGTVTSVRIGALHISAGQYGGIDAMVESLFDKASRYKVVATVKGFEPSVSYHEDYAAAAAKRDSFGGGVKVEFTGDQVTVLVDSDGEVVREESESE